ncbi:polysaccharide pyruvyl transferase family protein [Pelotomaculum sp. FP]|uniref:polysaccharide pyruvyl transferase family protein n=1 Tax=Pelotomaculum sp. FP TaxID=261474 RepID=UPI001FA9A56F|nr:polysaccharide pyruvyl transferase family protein [Pelotomaculum sp. FP]
MNYIIDARSPNIGDRALLSSIINTIKDSGRDVKIIVFSSDPDVVLREFEVCGVKYRPLNLKKILSELLRCDVFVFAGGEVVVDRGSALYTPFMLHAAFLVKLLRKKIMGYGIGIGEQHEISQLGKILTRMIFSNTIVSVRDIKSKESLLAMCKPKSLQCTADPVINLEPVSKEEIESYLATIGVVKNGMPLVAVVPRQLLMPLNKFSDRVCNIIPIKLRERMKLTPENFDGKIAAFQQNIANIGDYLVDKYNAEILFVPMFSGFMSYNDDLMCKDIIKKMKWGIKAKVVDNNLTAGAYKALFGKMDLVIGFPLHSIIFSTSMGVPVISFSYESKVERYMKALKLEKYNFNVKDLNHEIHFDQVVDTIENVMNNRDSIKKQLTNNIMALKDIERENIRLLFQNS